MTASSAQLSYPGRDLEAMSFAQNYHRWILDDIRDYIGECVAEVGAGSGDFSKFLVEANVRELFAYEPSATMYPLLEKKFLVDDRVKALNIFFDQSEGLEDYFDTICYINVLEHIEDDLSELMLARRRLKAGGHLCLFVPALSWLYSPLDQEIGHFRRYSKRGLSDLVSSAGLSIVRAKYFDGFGVIPWYIAYVLLKKRISSSDVTAYDRLVVPLERKLESVIPPLIGKNVLLIARKV